MADLIVHFKKPQEWNNTIKIHYWNTTPLSSSTTWPGVSMTAEGNDWFVYRFQGISAANIVFNDGARRQTRDLRREKEGWFFDDNRWYDQNPEQPKSDLIVHFKKPQEWNDTIKIHYWNTTPLSSSTTWSGVSMMAEGNDWFVYRFQGISATNIVFNDGSGQQTGNLRREKEGWFFDDNRWYDQNPEQAATPVITAFPQGDTYLNPQVVLLTSSNSDDIIYYTTDS